MEFTAEEKRGLYRAIDERRDVRAQFRPDPIPRTVLARVLSAAHAVPSVGFMQPWDFILIDDPALRHAIKQMFTRENERAAVSYESERATLYRALKLEGILESPLTRGGPHVLGRNTVLDADLFGVCLAIQNLWLAARAEGVGVGRVSILDPKERAELLTLPAQVYPVAYLCLGLVTEFLPAPELEQAGWRDRIPLPELLHQNRWWSAVPDAQSFGVECPTLG